MTARHATLLACGDVGPIHEPVSKYAELVKSTIATADIRFAQVERVYSERGALQVHSGGGHSRLPPRMADVFGDCGFNVVSVASNHAMDWGQDALIDTIELLRGKGMQVIGAGRNLEEARKPAFIESNGVRVAMLAYCSVLNKGFAAEKNKPGVAPLRAHTYYRSQDYQAGVPPKVVTIPYEEDLEGMISDIAKARQEADAVVVSHHWGVHFIPRMIADYQITAAKAAFDAGADLIVGHHAHVPKAIGVYKGKVCFYSLSNFIMGSPSKSAKGAKEFEEAYGTPLDPEYPHLAYGKDAKHSLVVRAEISSQGIQKVSFLPTLIDKQLRPEILHKGDPRFDEQVRYMEWASEGFDHHFSVTGDEVVVTQAP
jgi:poly-gamma-glutamate capsule biosynthesis protein CapA/YwtB (metallophosphatase superfamily)